MSSFDPLRIFVYDNGLARFATEKYSTSNKSCKVKYIHLTNFAINKKAPKFIKTCDTNVKLNLERWNRKQMEFKNL